MILSKAIFSKLIPSIVLFRSDSIRPIVFCAIGLCAGLYLFFNGFRLLQRRRLILDTPVSKIRKRIHGYGRTQRARHWPSHRGCSCHPALLLLLPHPGLGMETSGPKQPVVQVAAECMHLPFFLDDNTGQVLIDPRGAELDLHCDFHQEFCDALLTTKEEVPPNVRLLLSRHGINTTNKIKVEEYCIKPKNALFVVERSEKTPGLELTSQPIQDEEAISLAAGGLSFPLRRASLSLATEGSNIFSGILTGGLQHDPKFDCDLRQGNHEGFGPGNPALARTRSHQSGGHDAAAEISAA